MLTHVARLSLMFETHIIDPLTLYNRALLISMIIFSP